MDEKEIVNAYNNNLGIIKSAGEFIGDGPGNENLLSITYEAYVKLQQIIDSTEPETPRLRLIRAKKPQAAILGNLLAEWKKNHFSYGGTDLLETANSLVLDDYRQSEEAAEMRNALGQIKLYLKTPKHLEYMKMLGSLCTENNRVLEYGSCIEDQEIQKEIQVFGKQFHEYMQNLKTNFSDKPNLLYKSVQRLEELLKP